jgi:membrane protein
MAEKPSRFQKMRQDARAFLDENRADTVPSRLHRLVHFWILVCRSFSRNRCPVRASALAYATLLALIPMLAVAMSITSSLLKKEGEDRIDQFITKLVASVIPPAEMGTNLPPASANLTAESTNASVAAYPSAVPTNPDSAHLAPAPGKRTAEPTSGALSSFAEDQKAVAARKEIARRINEFIQNTQSGALGLTGTLLLIFVAISMLSRIEVTFNDIWGVTRGRTWFMRIVLYWGVLTLAPILLVVALGLATGPHLESSKRLLTLMPIVSNLTFQFLPVIVLCLTFALFYMLMPSAKVQWRAALVGGLVGGILLHLNNVVSVLYVSRVVSNSKIYGSLGLVPVFMVGLYFSWLILLFGAQVAYAFQNRATYLEEKQVENVDQRGREFIALRLMTFIGQWFSSGEPPASIIDLSRELSVPSRLIRQTLQTLTAARLVVETAGNEPAWLPARPLERITCHDILFAMRVSQGQELATRDEPARNEVYGEFQRIEEAERVVAASVTILGLVNRAQALLLQPEKPKRISNPEPSL